jgi:hypothetical protein
MDIIKPTNEEIHCSLPLWLQLSLHMKRFRLALEARLIIWSLTRDDASCRAEGDAVGMGYICPMGRVGPARPEHDTGRANLVESRHNTVMF